MRRWLASAAALALSVAPATPARAAPPEAPARAGGAAAPPGDVRQRPRLGRDQRTREGAYVIDSQGRRFRVAFPLYDRISIEGNTGLAAVGEGRGVTQPAGRLRADLSVSLDFSDEEVWWVMRHTLLDASLSSSGPPQRRRLRGVAVEGRYLRHDLSSFIVVPAANDLRVPANFDIAVDYRLGGLDATFGGVEGVELDRVEPFDLAFLADFIRDGDHRHRLAVGLASWYHASPGERWRHELSPVAAGKILYGWDQRDGLFRVYTEAICGAALHFDAEVEAPDWRWRCRGDLALEWTPLAISDAPLSVPIEVHVDVPLDDAAALDVFATVGLRWSLSLD